MQDVLVVYARAHADGAHVAHPLRRIAVVDPSAGIVLALLLLITTIITISIITILIIITIINAISTTSTTSYYHLQG